MYLKRAGKFSQIQYANIHVPDQNALFRSSRFEVSCKKGALKNLVKFTGKHLCQSLFFNKIALLKSRFGKGVLL